LIGGPIKLEAGPITARGAEETVIVDPGEDVLGPDSFEFWIILALAALVAARGIGMSDLRPATQVGRTAAGYAVTSWMDWPVKAEKDEDEFSQEEHFDLWPYCGVRRVLVEDPGASDFRKAYTKALSRAKKKYSNVQPEFEDDDLSQFLSAADRKAGWSFPLTRTEQKKEFGCVVVEQERFLARLQAGHLQIVEEYLSDPKKKAQIDVNRPDASGFAPLHFASKLGHDEIARLLLEAGAIIDLPGPGGVTAMQLAESGLDDCGANEEVIEVLKQFKAGKSKK